MGQQERGDAASDGVCAGEGITVPDESVGAHSGVTSRRAARLARERALAEAQVQRRTTRGRGTPWLERAYSLAGARSTVLPARRDARQTQPEIATADLDLSAGDHASSAEAEAARRRSTPPGGRDRALEAARRARPVIVAGAVVALAVVTASASAGSGVRLVAAADSLQEKVEFTLAHELPPPAGAAIAVAGPVGPGGLDGGAEASAGSSGQAVSSPGEVDTLSASDLTASGIPVVALEAYRRAERSLAASDPSCRLPWWLLAGIGRVETNHGQHGGAALLTDGTTAPQIRGIALNGQSGTRVIRDSDNGRLDGDTVYDRAVGPMQFIPTTWARFGADGDGDGTKNPDDIDDAARAAGEYLCASGADLSTDAGRRKAVLTYNNSTSYVDTVLQLGSEYLGRSDDGTLTTTPPSKRPPAKPSEPPVVVEPASSRGTSPATTSPTPTASSSPSPSPTQATTDPTHSPTSSPTESVSSPPPGPSATSTPSTTGIATPSPGGTATPSPGGTPTTNSPSASPTTAR